MKVSRRGLGGLFVGAVAASKATQDIPQDLQIGGASFNAGKAISNAAEIMSPEDELKYLLSELREPKVGSFHKRNRYEKYDIIDPDISALKSLSHVGRESIQRQRWHRAAQADHKDWIRSRLNELLERNPYLSVFI